VIIGFLIFIGGLAGLHIGWEYVEEIYVSH
jgi:hypothetical protein